MSFEGGVTIGILGRPWRATVTPWGDVVPWDGSERLVWAIAAEDRWHFPETETSTRYSTVRGTPVAETRVRVPNGDVVQRVWSASLDDGVSAVVLEFTNDSPASVAISLSRSDVVSSRPFHSDPGSERPWPSGDRGIDRPPLVVPIGHRSTVRVALPRSGNVQPADIDKFPGWEAVSNGWARIAQNASRLEIPDIDKAKLVDDRVRQWRCEVALDPPDFDRSSVRATALWMAAHRELVWMGLESADVAEVVSALEVLLRRIKRDRRFEQTSVRALQSGAILLSRSDARAFRDFTAASVRALRRVGAGDESDAIRILNTLARESRRRLAHADDVGRHEGVEESLDPVFEVESEFAAWSGSDEVTLMPFGFSEARLGADFEVHGIRTGPAHSVSLAIRWHGDRPAVIWEVDGPAGLVLRSGADLGWSSVERAGEALWQMTSMPSVSG